MADGAGKTSIWTRVAGGFRATVAAVGGALRAYQMTRRKGALIRERDAAFVVLGAAAEQQGLGDAEPRGQTIAARERWSAARTDSAAKQVALDTAKASLGSETKVHDARVKGSNAAYRSAADAQRRARAAVEAIEAESRRAADQIEQLRRQLAAPSPGQAPAPDMQTRIDALTRQRESAGDNLPSANAAYATATAEADARRAELDAARRRAETVITELKAKADAARRDREQAAASEKSAEGALTAAHLALGQAVFGSEQQPGELEAELGQVRRLTDAITSAETEIVAIRGTVAANRPAATWFCLGSLAVVVLAIAVTWGVFRMVGGLRGRSGAGTVAVAPTATPGRPTGDSDPLAGRRAILNAAPLPKSGSEAIDIRPIPELRIVAAADALDKPRTFKVARVSGEAQRAIARKLVPAGAAVLVAVDIDAGMAPHERFREPVQFEFDLKKLGLQPEHYPHARLLRTDERGNFVLLDTQQAGDQLVVAARHNGVVIPVLLGLGGGVLAEYLINQYQKHGFAQYYDYDIKPFSIHVARTAPMKDPNAIQKLLDEKVDIWNRSYLAISEAGTPRETLETQRVLGFLANPRVVELNRELARCNTIDWHKENVWSPEVGRAVDALMHAWCYLIETRKFAKPDYVIDVYLLDPWPYSPSILGYTRDLMWTSPYMEFNIETAPPPRARSGGGHGGRRPSTAPNEFHPGSLGRRPATAPASPIPLPPASEPDRTSSEPLLGDEYNATACHELFHIVQKQYVGTSKYILNPKFTVGYADSNLWFMEATACVLETEIQEDYKTYGWNKGDIALTMHASDAWGEPKKGYFREALQDPGSETAQDHGYGAAFFLLHLRDQYYSRRSRDFLPALMADFGCLTGGPVTSLRRVTSNSSELFGWDYLLFATKNADEIEAQWPPPKATPLRLSPTEPYVRWPLTGAAIGSPCVRVGFADTAAANLAGSQLVIRNLGLFEQGVRTRILAGSPPAWKSLRAEPYVAPLMPPGTPGELSAMLQDGFALQRVEMYEEVPTALASGINMGKSNPIATELLLLLAPPAPRMVKSDTSLTIEWEHTPLYRCLERGNYRYRPFYPFKTYQVSVQLPRMAKVKTFRTDETRLVVNLADLDPKAKADEPVRAWLQEVVHGNCAALIPDGPEILGPASPAAELGVPEAVPAWVLTGRTLKRPVEPFVGEAKGLPEEKETWSANWQPLPCGGVTQFMRAWDITRRSRQSDGSESVKTYRGVDRYNTRLAWTCPVRIAAVPNVDATNYRMVPLVATCTQPDDTPLRTGNAPLDGGDWHGETLFSVLTHMVAPDGKPVGGDPTVIIGGRQLGAVTGEQGGVFGVNVQFRFDPVWWPLEYEKTNGKYPFDPAKRVAGEGWKTVLTLIGTQTLAGWNRPNSEHRFVAQYEYSFVPVGGAVQPLASEIRGDLAAHLGLKTTGKKIDEALPKLRLLESFKGVDVLSGPSAKPIDATTRPELPPGTMRVTDLRYVPADPKEGDQITLELVVANPPAQPSYSWNFGDPPGRTQPDAWTEVNRIEWTYLKAGTYTISVIARDKKNYSTVLDKGTWKVTVRPVSP